MLQRPRPLDPHALADHSDRLHRVARGLCGSPFEADDLVQDTFERVLRRPRHVRGGDELGYLLRALRNTFLSRRRAAARRPEPAPRAQPDELEERRSSTSPAAALEASEALRAIAALAEDMRAVLVAVDIAGLSYRETAAALGVPEGTVMSRLARARGHVVRRLDGGAPRRPQSIASAAFSPGLGGEAWSGEHGVRRSSPSTTS